MVWIEWPGSTGLEARRNRMRVAKEKLLLIAGFVWLAAGLNITILGVSAFTEMGEHAMLVLVPAAIVAFTVFHAGRPY